MAKSDYAALAWLTSGLIILSYSISLYAKLEFDPRQIVRAIKAEFAQLNADPNQVFAYLEKFQATIPELERHVEAFSERVGNGFKQGSDLSKQLDAFYTSLLPVLQQVDAAQLPGILMDSERISTLPQVAQASAGLAQEGLQNSVKIITTFPISAITQAYRSMLDSLSNATTVLDLALVGAGSLKTALLPKKKIVKQFKTFNQYANELRPTLQTLAQAPAMGLKEVKEKLAEQARDNPEKLQTAARAIGNLVSERKNTISALQKNAKQLSLQSSKLLDQAKGLGGLSDRLLRQSMEKKNGRHLAKRVDSEMKTEFATVKPILQTALSLLASQLDLVAQLVGIGAQIEPILVDLNLNRLVTPSVQEALAALNEGSKKMRELAARIKRSAK